MLIKEELHLSKKELHIALQDLETFRSKESETITELRGKLERAMADLTKLKVRVTKNVTVQTDEQAIVVRIQ